MKINKEMAEHLIRFHKEYSIPHMCSIEARTYYAQPIKDVFVLLEYLLDELDKKTIERNDHAMGERQGTSS